MSLPNDFKLSIQDAADRLGVSTKTLRRWETKGLITPHRTVGNQRRYSLTQIDTFQQQSTSQATTPNLKVSSTGSLKPVLAALFLITLPLASLFFKPKFISPISQSKTNILGQFNTSPLSPTQSHVLGNQAIKSDYVFNVNVPASFNDLVSLYSASVSGNLTVQGQIVNPNLLTGLIAGEGLEVTAGQSPIISNLDPGSGQFIFSTIKLGDNSVTAGSNTDTFEFTAGGTTSLSLDTTNKKLTITGATPNYTESGWTNASGKVTLSTITDNIGIGTSNPAYKLEVTGTGYFSDTLTANNGLIVTGAANISNSTTITGALQRLW